MKINGQIAPSEALSIYLQDHYAGAQGGTALAHRAAENQAGTSAGPALSRLADEIEEDESTLRRVMEQLDVDPNRVKDIGAALGEKLGRLKLNGQLTGESPLSPVIEIEGLLSAVKSKQHVWEALRDRANVPIEGVDMDRMLARGEDQIDRLHALWSDATSSAFPG